MLHKMSFTMIARVGANISAMFTKKCLELLLFTLIG